MKRTLSEWANDTSKLFKFNQNAIKIILKRDKCSRFTIMEILNSHGVNSLRQAKDSKETMEVIKTDLTKLAFRAGIIL